MPTEPSLGNILIVDADDNISELLKINLGSEGYAVRRVLHAREVEHDSLGDVSLIIVDSIGEEYSGMDLIYDLKDNPLTEHVGIILYSNIKGERMIIDALDAGADDYLVKPFATEELMARIRAVTRRSGDRLLSGKLCVSGLSLDPEQRLMEYGTLSFTLSKRESSLLEFFLRNPRQTLPRSRILSYVWGSNSEIEEGNLDNYIHFLRRRLKASGAPVRLITVHGIGYRLEENPLTE